jgi:hypothetical protein
MGTASSTKQNCMPRKELILRILGRLDDNFRLKNLLCTGLRGSAA